MQEDRTYTGWEHTITVHPKNSLSSPFCHPKISLFPVLPFFLPSLSLFPVVCCFPSFPSFLQVRKSPRLCSFSPFVECLMCAVVPVCRVGEAKLGGGGYCLICIFTTQPFIGNPKASQTLNWFVRRPGNIPETLCYGLLCETWQFAYCIFHFF